MSRLSEVELARLKKELPLEQVCRLYGIALKKHGTHDLIGRCPFHHDKTPSFVVTPSKNLWHCLGACQQGGSVIDFDGGLSGKGFEIRNPNATSSCGCGRSFN